jgi:hypothetical protein
MAMKAVANPNGAPKVLWADLGGVQMAAMIALVFVQIVYVTMVYGPIAAFLVELFPTKIRYTSMSLPYHLGNGWFGGFLPLIATAVTSSAVAKAAFGGGAIFAGLLYPISVALVTLVVGSIFIKETKDHKIDTVVATDTVAEASFDWTAVLLAMAGGYALLVVVGPYLPAVAGLGVGAASVGAALFTLIPAFAACGLPTIFFRLAYPRGKALAFVFGSLAVWLGVAAVVHPLLREAGGATRFFADAMILGLYAVLLTGVYYGGRPKVAIA